MRWGSVDYKQLQKLRNNLQRLQEIDMDKFCRDMSKGLAARLLQLVIPVTPVGQYPKSTGKKGGTLHRGWTAKTEQEAASGSGNGMNKMTSYVNALPVFKRGRTFYIDVINPVHYASYVEFGHRTPGGKGWVEGKYFLAFAERQLESRAPAIIEKELEKKLKEVFKV